MGKNVANGDIAPFSIKIAKIQIEESSTFPSQMRVEEESRPLEHTSSSSPDKKRPEVEEKEIKPKKDEENSLKVTCVGLAPLLLSMIVEDQRLWLEGFSISHCHDQFHMAGSPL